MNRYGYDNSYFVGKSDFISVVPGVYEKLTGMMLKFRWTLLKLFLHYPDNNELNFAMLFFR